MDPVALVLGCLGGLVVVVLAVGIRQLLWRKLRKTSAHTETRPAGGSKSAGPQAADEAPLAPAAPVSSSPGPTQVLMTYAKADGSVSVRNLSIYSRNLKDGQTHSLNCRQQGERITKQFLLTGISRLELPGLSPPLVLNSSQEISAWVERVIPERSSAARASRSTAQPAPVGAGPEAAPKAIRPETLPAFPPPPSAPAQVQPPAARPAPAALPGLLPVGARGFAVLDLETTGTGRSCRIVEIALVRLDPQGRITEEWTTLVHPGMPIPNAHIHGIDDAQVAGAPSFEEIAGTVAAKLHEHVLVAHNLHGFDGPILEAHFAEVDGIELTLGSGVDTMPTPRIKLVDLCARHGVELDPGVAHTALGDTRALASALQSGMAHLEPAGSAVAVQRNERLKQPARTLTRAMVTATKAPSGWNPVSIQLEAGQLFMTTGPASMKADTEIKRAEAHGTRIGLQYRKVSALPRRQPPAFLLSTSLTLASRKMADARELQIPVLLCRDFMQAGSGTTVRGWLYQA